MSQQINRRGAWLSFVACAAALLLGTAAHAQTSAFTYQGKLSDAGAPANGAFDFEFKLFDAGGAPDTTEAAFMHIVF